MGEERHTYNLHLPKAQAHFLLDDVKRAGLTRSAIVRRAIDNIPLAAILETPPGARAARTDEERLIKVSFAISQAQRTKLDELQRGGFEGADLVRAALEPYLALSIEQLQQIPEFLRAPNRLAAKKLAIERKVYKDVNPDSAATRAEIIRSAARESIARAGINETPVMPEIFPEPKVGMVPVHVPSIDWTGTGPVSPKPGDPRRTLASKNEPTQAPAPSVEAAGAETARVPKPATNIEAAGVVVDERRAPPKPQPKPENAEAMRKPVSALDALRALKK